jgi:hypothetical protein
VRFDIPLYIMLIAGRTRERDRRGGDAIEMAYSYQFTV